MAGERKPSRDEGVEGLAYKLGQLEELFRDMVHEHRKLSHQIAKQSEILAEEARLLRMVLLSIECPGQQYPRTVGVSVRTVS